MQIVCNTITVIVVTASPAGQNVPVRKVFLAFRRGPCAKSCLFPRIVKSSVSHLSSGSIVVTNLPYVYLCGLISTLFHSYNHESGCAMPSAQGGGDSTPCSRRIPKSTQVSGPAATMQAYSERACGIDTQAIYPRRQNACPGQDSVLAHSCQGT